MFSKVKIKSINSHVEVYNLYGKFLFSADNETEALTEIENNYN